jgi:dTDP-4-dehydrorhamnose 3,5-epimerase
MIDGVSITPLRQILDERGKVMHMLRNTDPSFTQFGEIYFSRVFPGAVKAWHIHERMTLNYAVPHGKIKFVLFDDREQSPTKGQLQEIFLGEDNYQLVSVPPLVWNGFKGIGSEIALVANCASIPHDPTEIRRLDPENCHIPYDWTIKNR